MNTFIDAYDMECSNNSVNGKTKIFDIETECHSVFIILLVVTE